MDSQGFAVKKILGMRSDGIQTIKTEDAHTIGIKQKRTDFDGIGGKIKNKNRFLNPFFRFDKNVSLENISARVEFLKRYKISPDPNSFFFQYWHHGFSFFGRATR